MSSVPKVVIDKRRPSRNPYKRLYIGRTLTSIDMCPYELGTTKSKWDSADGFQAGAHLGHYCVDTFERITGLVLEPGEIRRVRIVVEDLDNPAVCEWTYDDITDIWDSECGELWNFVDGGPEDNRVRFCHGCGKPVKVVGARND